ncbi:hypothetical protein AYO20_03965 [Fonsecaea nubica]|uniref:Uncharacterized protein n=1 Tax=Fonsecaea nubica TaxID=856822 RepID=A0A178D5T6_9EURO|nr:hypothetical protein AYO20_03965 [Fonsecaea nubica]OAL36633.1 hypothetical protein AYO20_03965 [Fonsecaea nubica]
MAPTNALREVRRMDPLFQDCEKAKGLMDRVAKPRTGPPLSTSQIRPPLVGIEKSLRDLQRLLLSPDRQHHPFREASHEDRCFRAILEGCAQVLASTIYNLNLLATRKFPDPPDLWDECHTLIEIYHKNLDKLVCILGPAQDGPRPLEFLESIDTTNKRATLLKQMVNENIKQATTKELSSTAQTQAHVPEKEQTEGKRSPAQSTLTRPKAQAPEKDQTEGKRSPAKSTPAQPPPKSTHTGSHPNPSRQSHGDHTGHRGGEEGRGNVCKALKRLGILQDKALKGNRALWLLKAIDIKDDRDSLEMVRLLLELGFDPNQESPDPNTEITKEPEDPKDRKYPKDRPLCYAAKKGKSDIVELLIENGAEINARNDLGETALLSAAKWGMDEVVKHLLNAPHNADIETQRQGAGRSYVKGFTPLMLAVYNGRLNTVKLLLNRGANRDVVDQAGNPLFYIAISRDKVGIVDFLVDKKPAEIAGTNKEYPHDTPLHCAARNGSIKVASYLVDTAPALINARNEEGDAPLSLAVKEKPRDLEVRKKQCEVVELLLNHKADINATDRKGRTPLHNSALAGDAEMIQKLVDVGAKTEYFDIEGQTALHCAVSVKDVASVEALLAGDSNIDCLDNRKGQTPLHHAVIGEDPALVRVLLGRGCKRDVNDHDGKYPLQYVMDMDPLKKASSRELLCAFLHDNKNQASLWAGFPVLSKASQDGKLVFVQEIIKSHSNLVSWKPQPPFDSTFKPALHEAVRNGQKQVLEALCKVAKNPQAINLTDHAGNTVLHQAIISNRPEWISQLIRLGADKELVSGEADGSLPPLHLAARHMNVKAIKALLDEDVDAKRRIPGGQICDVCMRLRTTPSGRNARCILRNLDPSRRSDPNFLSIDQLLRHASTSTLRRGLV